MYTCREFTMLAEPTNHDSPNSTAGARNHDSRAGSACTSTSTASTNITAKSSDGAWGAYVVLDGDDQGLATGQYAVLYQGGTCLGAAKITAAAAA